MKKIFVFSSIFTLAITSLFAQKATKAAYVELGGPGLASVNYDMRLMPKNDGLGFRVGVGGFSVGDEDFKSTAIFVPLGLNYLLGKDDKHFFELGAGVTIVSTKEKNSFSNPDSEDDKFSSTFGHLYLGYRIQPKEGGFLFRAGVTPVFGKNYFFPFLPAISFGYAF